MKRVPLSEVKDDLSRYVDLATREAIVVTRHGRPAAVLIGFEDDDDWFEYQLEHDPRFVARMENARRNLEAGRGISLEETRKQLGLADHGGRRVPSAKRALARKSGKAKKRAR